MLPVHSKSSDFYLIDGVTVVYIKHQSENMCVLANVDVASFTVIKQKSLQCIVLKRFVISLASIKLQANSCFVINRIKIATYWKSAWCNPFFTSKKLSPSCSFKKYLQILIFRRKWGFYTILKKQIDHLLDKWVKSSKSY